MKKALLLLTALFAFGASAEAGAVRLKVKKSADQPEVTAIAGGQAFAQFTTVEITGVKKGKMALNNVRVEIYSEGKFGVENTPTIGEVFKKICFIVNTSPGNSEVVERTIISSLIISKDTGFVIDLGTFHWFGDNAKFTVVGIPRDEAFSNQNGRTIGLAVTGISASDKKGKKAKMTGKVPLMGTEQVIDPNAWAGSVFWGRTTINDNGNIYPAIYMWGTNDVVVKKIVFQRYLGKDAKIVVKDYASYLSREYDCLVDKADNLTACNFYTKERELSANNGVESLSAGSDGIYLSAGSCLYIYSPNDSSLLNHFFDPNDIVVVGAYMNYRYAPQW